MFRLATLLFSMIAATTAGIAIVTTLVLGYDTLTPILIAAGTGFIIAIPATWIVSQKLSEPR